MLILAARLALVPPPPPALDHHRRGHRARAGDDARVPGPGPGRPRAHGRARDPARRRPTSSCRAPATRTSRRSTTWSRDPQAVAALARGAPRRHHGRAAGSRRAACCRRARPSAGVAVAGVDPELEPAVSTIASPAGRIAGDYLRPRPRLSFAHEPADIYVGAQLARTLELALGDRVVLDGLAARQRAARVGRVPRARRVPDRHRRARRVLRRDPARRGAGRCYGLGAAVTQVARVHGRHRRHRARRRRARRRARRPARSRGAALAARAARALRGDRARRPRLLPDDGDHLRDRRHRHLQHRADVGGRAHARARRDDGHRHQQAAPVRDRAGRGGDPRGRRLARSGSRSGSACTSTSTTTAST